MAKTSRARRRRTQLAALSALAVLAVYGGIKVTLFITGRPTVSVNYAAEYNRRTQPAGYDPNDDAAPLYREALAQLAAPPPDMSGLGRIRLWDCEPASIEWKIVERWVNSSTKALDTLDRAAWKPCLWVQLSTIDCLDPASIQGFDFDRLQEAVSCLRYRAEYLAVAGDVSGAFRCIITLDRMARHVGNRAMLVSVGQILGLIMDYNARTTAFELLARMDIDSNLLHEVQTHLEEVLAARKPPQFRGDEVLLWDAVQRYFTDNGKADGHLVTGIVFDRYLRENAAMSELAADMAYLRHLHLAWRHPSRRQTMGTIHGLMEYASCLAGQTPWELHAKGTSHAEQLKDAIHGNYFLQHLTVDTRLARTIEVFHRDRAAAEALITTIGILRFQKDKGRLPQSIDELAASGYIRRVPIDPYSGVPLVYRPTESSFRLYSLGHDFDDDGGTPSHLSQRPDLGDHVYWPREERKK